MPRKGAHFRFLRYSLSVLLVAIFTIVGCLFDFKIPKSMTKENWRFRFRKQTKHAPKEEG